MEQISSQMAKKIAESFNGIRQKSKSIKKENSVSLTNNINAKNANSLQTTLNSTEATQINLNASISGNNNNLNNNNNLSTLSSTSASLSSIQKRVKFTSQEDDIILKYVQKHGKKWSEISKRLPGRTEVMVRNRYYVKIRKISKEKENGNIDQSNAQNEDNGQFQIENSSQDFNEQASDIHLTSTGALQKLHQTEQGIQDQRGQNIDTNNIQNITYNTKKYPIYFNANSNEDIFNSPIKQDIFQDDIINRPFNQNQIYSQHNIDEHHNHFDSNHYQNYQQKEQNIFNSVVKEFPENLQSTHPFFDHENLNINQNNQLFNNNIHTSKAVLLSNQQYNQLPFSNVINPLQSLDDDDYFEEANMPFKLPKFELQFDDEFSDISGFIPPIGAMDMNINNSSIDNSDNNNINNIHPPQGEAAKQQKIQFLQNQISMIENMLNMCKDEIIREFAQRKSISVNPEIKNLNINGITSNNSTPLTHLINTKQEELEASQSQQESFQPNNALQSIEEQLMKTSMDVEENLPENIKNSFIFEEQPLNTNNNYLLPDQSQIITSLNNF